MTTQKDLARIAVVPGDGIGPEVIAEAIKVLRAAVSTAGKKLQFTEFDWGAERFLRDGTTLPEGSIEMLRGEFDAILFGAIGDPRIPSNTHALEILLTLRFRLDLYANVRPCELLDARLCPLRDRSERDVAFTVIRENTEGIYAGMGGVFKRDTADEVATQEDINTRKGVERIIRYAFEFARRRGKKRVCMSDKSNALTFGHGLWQRVFKTVRKEYADIDSRHLLIDTLAMEVVRDPSQFDVIVTCNLFGDIISDLGAQLAGGMGLAPSANLHPGSLSLFEPVHGSAPDIAGKSRANPAAACLAAAMMLEDFGWDSEASAIKEAVRAAVRGRHTTPELGGTLGTREAGDWIANQVARAGVAR